MAETAIKRKGLINNQLDLNEALAKVNEHTVEPLGIEDVYLFEVELCDNDIDRVGDHMTDEFLQQVADSASGLTGLKDHDWSMDNQISRLYDAEIRIDPSKQTRLMEPRRYVLGKAYTLSKYKDYIDKINAGLLKECSISFESSGDTCSICGSLMTKDANDIGHCENGHVALQEYDGQLCYTNLNNLTDTLEWSLVAVPCQHNAGIKNKSIGGNVMKKTELLIRQFMSSKGFKAASKEEQAKLEEALKETEDKELSDEDIKGLVDENEKLKAKVKELEQKVADSESGRKRDKIESIVSKAVDDMKPMTPKVKDMFMKDIPWDDLELEDGQIPGLDNVFAGMKKDYDGLFASEEETEEVGGHDEPDGDEAGVVMLNEKGEPDGDEGKLMVMDKGCGGKSKGLKPNAGQTKNVTNKSAVKPGISWK